MQRAQTHSGHDNRDLRYIYINTWSLIINAHVRWATLFSVCRLRGRGFDSCIGTSFFFTPFFFCPPFFFLHARSATSMLKHFSSYTDREVLVRSLPHPTRLYFNSLCLQEAKIEWMHTHAVAIIMLVWYNGMDCEMLYTLEIRSHGLIISRWHHQIQIRLVCVTFMTKLKIKCKMLHCTELAPKLRNKECFTFLDLKLSQEHYLYSPRYPLCNWHSSS